MSAESQNFEALKKLLAVKRHEVPPPGYFDQMASEVRARLNSGEHRQEDLWRDLGDEASWLQRLWYLFSARPALAGACGMAICAVAMMVGIFYSQSGEEVANPSVAQGQTFGSMPAQPVASSLALGGTQASSLSSTNPVSTTPAPAGIFDHIPGQATEVNFSPSGQ